MWMIHALLNILFPPKCLGCAKALSPLCERCIKLSRKCLSSPYAHTISLFDFKDPVIRKAIHSIKYYHRKDLIAPLANALALEMKKMPKKSYILVPIPMPTLRKLIRGYNQAELIAEALSKELGFPVQKILTRFNASIRQVTTKSKAERLRNQKGSFVVKNMKADGDFILVDDVTTTGATLHEARQTLLHAGAHTVTAVTLAH